MVSLHRNGKVCIEIFPWLVESLKMRGIYTADVELLIFIAIRVALWCKLMMEAMR